MTANTLGIPYLISGFKLITKPGLKRFVIIPLMINISLFIGLFFLLNYFVKEFNTWFSHFLPAWLQWLSTVLWIFFFLAFFILVVYAFVTIANLISAPFNSFLAEKVEFYLTGKVFEDRSLLQNIQDIPRIIRRQLSIIAYYVPRAFLLLILLFVPLIHLFVPLFAFLFHAWTMTLTYMDYPTDNHRIPMPEVHRWLKERRLESLGFGAGVLVLSMVPIVNCFVIPAAVAGATEFWVKEKGLV
jgi:CysZ protein